MSETMTRRDREDLMKLNRARVKVERQQIKARVSELDADFARKLTRLHKEDDERWQAMAARAKAAVEEANRLITAACGEEGIPQEWAPSLAFGWSERGENFSRARRAELKYLAAKELVAAAERANTEVERRALALDTELVSGTLDTAAAKAFLDKMPTVPELMSELSIEALQGKATAFLKLPQESEYTYRHESTANSWNDQAEKLLKPFTGKG